MGLSGHPRADALRRALTWISARRKEAPLRPLLEVVEEASKEFDLSPLDEEFLYRELRNPGGEP